MESQFNLKDAEKQVFRLANFEDGILDIFLGAIYLLLSFYSLTRKFLGPVFNIIFVIVLLLIMTGLFWLAKKQIVMPRIGQVQFSHRTKVKIKTAHLILVTLVILTFLVLVLASQSLLIEPNWRSLPQWVSDLDMDMIFALVIIIIFSLIAFGVNVPRFHIYGVLIGLGNFFSAVLSLYFGQLFQWPVALAGILITLTGVVILYRFIQAHPIPGEGNHG